MNIKLHSYVVTSGSVCALRWDLSGSRHFLLGQRCIGTSSWHKIHAPEKIGFPCRSYSRAAEKHTHNESQQVFDKNGSQRQGYAETRECANARVNAGVDAETHTSTDASANTNSDTISAQRDPSRTKSSVQKVAEDLYTVPNALTATRIAMCPIIGWAVMTHRPFWAVGLLSVAAATDLLDGWIARRWKSYTVFGSIADPAADKLLMATMVISLSASGQMPLWLALVILGRDVYLMLLAFYLRFRSLPKPRTFARYWDPRYPSVHVSPTQLSKYNTFLQLLLVASLTVYPCLPEQYQLHPHVQRTKDALEWIVAITTIWTGLQYAFTRQSVRYLHVRSKT